MAASDGDEAPLRAVLQLAKGEASRVGEARVRLLEAIAQKGSISAAAKAVGLSY
jgi:molybdenum-dependent DNA-binding transcriptional regulator ModE